MFCWCNNYMTGNIFFKNKPKLSENLNNEVQVRFNERRLALVPVIENFLLSHPRFQGKDVLVTFSQEGASSLVLIIEVLREKLVLKVSLSNKNCYGEADFLRVWEKAGVKVPHIFEDGNLGDHPYILMEFIDAPLLSNLYSHEERIEKGIYKEMGQILRLMHQPKASGFGRVLIDGGAEYDNFSDWLNGEEIQKRLSMVKELNLIGEEHGSLSSVLEILKKHVGDGVGSSYCHDDFGGNIFATEPFTVFDPNPMFNNGYLDVGRTIANHIAQGVFPEGFIEAYFDGEIYSKKVLHSAVFLNAVMKLPYQVKNNKNELVKNVQNYLIKNRSLIED